MRCKCLRGRRTCGLTVHIHRLTSSFVGAVGSQTFFSFLPFFFARVFCCRVNPQERAMRFLCKSPQHRDVLIITPFKDCWAPNLARRLMYTGDAFKDPDSLMAIYVIVGIQEYPRLKRRKNPDPDLQLHFPTQEAKWILTSQIHLVHSDYFNDQDFYLVIKKRSFAGWLGGPFHPDFCSFRYRHNLNILECLIFNCNVQTIMSKSTYCIKWVCTKKIPDDICQVPSGSPFLTSYNEKGGTPCISFTC